MTLKTFTLTFERRCVTQALKSLSQSVMRVILTSERLYRKLSRC